MKDSDGSANKPEKGRSRSRRRNERRNRNRQNRVSREKVNGPDCSICDKPIRDVSAAVTYQETEKPAHFDCILKKLADSETLEAQEKIVYLGSGDFGVVKIINNKKFEIIRKIKYENSEERIDWRKDMRFQFPEATKKAR
jgi:hypothetical protein